MSGEINSWNIRYNGLEDMVGVEKRDNLLTWNIITSLFNNFKNFAVQFSEAVYLFKLPWNCNVLYPLVSVKVNLKAKSTDKKSHKSNKTNIYGLSLLFATSNINEKRVNIKILKTINLNATLFCIYSLFLWSVYYIDVNSANIKFMKLSISCQKHRYIKPQYNFFTQISVYSLKYDRWHT